MLKYNAFLVRCSCSVYNILQNIISCLNLFSFFSIFALVMVVLTYCALYLFCMYLRNIYY